MCIRDSIDALNGNVGIGTTSPIAALDIDGGPENDTVPALSIRGGLYSESDLYVLNTYNDSTVGGVGYAAKVIGVNIKNKVETNNTVQIRSNSGGLTCGSAMYLGSDDAISGVFGILTGDGVVGTTLTEKLTVRASGNVGIGVTTPQAPFHVKPVNNTSDLENTLLDFRGDFTGSNHGYLGIFATETHTNAIGPDLRFKGAVYNNTANPAINQVMCLKPSGSVGIGTTSPSSKLTVNQIPQHRNTYDHSLAPVTITNRTVTSNTTLNDPQHVLNLAREGTSGQAYGARATFKLSRWENSGVNSRTRLDLDMAHDYYNEVTVMKWYSNGTVNLSSGTAVTSDDRIKYNEEDIPNALETLNKLKPQKYEKLLFAPEKTGRWIPGDNEWETLKVDTGYTWINEYGFIAQDVREVPELTFLVHGEEIQMDTKNVTLEEYNELNDEERSNYTQKFIYESNVITLEEYTSLTIENRENYTELYSKRVETQTPLGLNYQGIFVIAVKAIQELKSENETLKTQLTSVLARLDALENAS